MGGRSGSSIAALPSYSYSLEKGKFTKYDNFNRFRFSSWVIDSFVYVNGGSDSENPSIPSYFFKRIDTSSIFPENNTKVNQELKNQKIKKKIPNPASGDPSIILKGNKDFSLSTHALIASSLNVEVSEEISKLVRSLPIDSLQEESKKLISKSKDTRVKTPYELKIENLSNLFISYLYKPKDWTVWNMERKFMIPSEKVIELATECQKILEKQPIVLKLKTPIKIFGDIHGQYQDIMRFFDLWRGPTDLIHGGDIDSYDYLFLGDYVYRGAHSLETICLLMALKLKYPEQIHLLRGNHEDRFINNSFGFAEECAERLGEDYDDPNSVFQTLNNMFEWFPLIAIIEDKIMCLHGGIGSSFVSIEDVNKLIRPLTVEHEVNSMEEQTLIDILWSDPTDNDHELGIQSNAERDPSGTGSIVRFGPDRVEQFIKLNRLTLIIRGHECVMDGIERFAKGLLITVFSATDYCNKHKNAGAILVINKNHDIIPKLIFPVDQTNQSNWIESEKRPQTPPKWKQN